MVSFSILYDEYIDRPKLTEQKKPFVYILPPPTRNNKVDCLERHKVIICLFQLMASADSQLYKKSVINLFPFLHRKSFKKWSGRSSKTDEG